MKGENEFVKFLVAGLVILAVLMAIFNLYVQYSGPACCTNQTPGYIEAVKTFPVPQFSASNMIETKTTELVSRHVYSGLLFGEDKIVYDLSKSALQDVKIKFKITSTNELGRLMIKVNDNLIENKVFSPGEYEIKVPSELISDRMIITIEADSSYWKIWAPTLYRITDASITFTSYFSEASQFKFYLGEEYMNLRFAKVDVIFTENVGKLLVDLNGRNVWNSPAANLQSIVLDKANLRLGDNIIRFAGDKDSKFTGYATIVVIFVTQYPEGINQSGVVTAVNPYVGTY
ncbi:MAG: hypothetical protein NT120_04620 [Candidatus Aenigmarchaeota archaeon]|nr:hypothetical protein [Candidatus Aenigmarchaeota archaeon]